MITIKFNKLVRDKIDYHMINNGAEIKLKDVKNNKELLEFYKDKIIEEAKEVKEATTKEEIIEELADLYEVIYGFSNLLKIDFDKIEKVRLKKLNERGGFKDGIVLDTVKVDRNNKFADHFFRNPNKYEIL